MEKNTNKDLEQLRYTVEKLSARVELLEEKLGFSSMPIDFSKISVDELSANSHSVLSDKTIDNSTLMINNKTIDLTMTAETLSQPRDELFLQCETASDQFNSLSNNTACESQSLEARIGLYWLSRLGVGFLVVGVALLILYSFQYFAAWSKLLTGFIVSGLLLWFGEFISNKHKMSWYGNALAGGGWSLTYFTSYAMHHVQQVRVIEDPLFASISMLTVACLAVFHSLKKNSEIIASLAVMLGFITLGLSEIGLFSASASLILTGTLAYLVHRRKWLSLYSIGIISAYSFLLISGKFVDSHISEISRLSFTLFFVIPYWFTASILSLSLAENDKRVQRTTVCVSVFTFFMSFFVLRPAITALNAEAYLFACSTFVYAILAWGMKKQKRSAVSFIYGLITLTSAALFVTALNHGPINLIAWSIQLVLILWLGLKYNIVSFRFFSYPFSLFLFCASLLELFDRTGLLINSNKFPWSVFYIFPTLFVFASAMLFFRSNTFAKVILSSTRIFSFYWYSHLCGILSFCSVPIIFMTGGNGSYASALSYVSLSWSVLAFIIGLLALRWKLLYFILVSFAGLFLSFSVSLFSELTTTQLIATLLSIGLSVLLAFKSRKADESMNPRILFATYFFIASLWLFTYQHMHALSSDLLSFVLIAEMFIYILLGIKIKDVLVRACGIFTACYLFSVILFDTRISWLAVIFSVASLYTLAQIYRNLSSNCNDGRQYMNHLLRDLFNGAATFALSSFIGWRLEGYLVSCAWAIEGLLLLVAGFLFSDKLLRISALVVFGLLVVHLLIYDLSGAATIYRIVAFILTGLMFMLSAFAYNKFKKA